MHRLACLRWAQRILQESAVQSTSALYQSSELSSTVQTTSQSHHLARKVARSKKSRTLTMDIDEPSTSTATTTTTTTTATASPARPQLLSKRPAGDGAGADLVRWPQPLTHLRRLLWIVGRSR